VLTGPGVENPALGALAAAPDGAAAVVGSEGAALVLARTSTGAANSAFYQGGTLTEPRLESESLSNPALAARPSNGVTVAAGGKSAGSGDVLIGIGSDGRQEPGPNGGGAAVASEVTGMIQAIRGGLAFVARDGKAVRASDLAGAPLRGFGSGGGTRLPPRLGVTAIGPGPRGGLTIVGTIGHERGMGVLRLDGNGRPVSGFGRKGLATVAFGGPRAGADAALVEPDGKVVVTGWAAGHLAVARFLANGRVDRGFGDRGRVRDLLSKSTYGSQIAPLDGGVVIAGVGEKLPRKLKGIVRLDARGRLVRGFGKRGVLASKDRAPLSLFTGSGRITLVTAKPGGGVTLRGLRTDGSPDRSYGRGGIVVAAAHQSSPFAPTAAIQRANGKIVVVGATGLRPGKKPEPAQVELLRFR
jgi:hypothetical protein